MTAYLIEMPIGAIMPTVLGPNSVPKDWLLCDGSDIPIKYPQLRALLGSDKTPNLIGRTLIGAGSFAKAQTSQTDNLTPNFATLSKNQALQTGDTGGECAHMLVKGEMPTHSHTINGGQFGLHGRSFKGESDSDLPYETHYDTAIGGTDTTGGDLPHYNVQPYMAVNYIIYGGAT